MAPIRRDFTIWRGTAPTLDISVVKDDGSPEDITTWTAALTLRQNAADPDPPALTKNAVIVGAPSAGLFRVSLTSAETLTLAPGRYAFTFERTNVGDEAPLTFGIATVRLDVRHAAPAG